MAYITSTTSSASEAASASYTPDALPPHITDDVIFACVTQDGGGTTIATATSGWTAIGTQAASGASRQVWFYKVATSSSETIPAFTGANDDWIVQFINVRDADTTNPIHAQARDNWVSINNPSTPAVTTTNNNCLILYSFGSDSSNEMITPPSSMVPIDASLGSGQSSITGFRNQYVAGAVPVITALHETSTEGGNTWTIAVENASGGSMGPEVTSAMDILRYYGANNWGGNFAALSTVAASINGITCSSNLPTIGTTINSDSPWGVSTLITTSTSTTPAFEGAVDTLAAAVDLSDTPVSVLFNIATSITAVRYGPFGVGMIFVDGSGNWVAYQLMPRSVLRIRTYAMTIHPGEGTIYDQSASPIDLTNITKIGWFSERTASTTAPALYAVKFMVRQSGAVVVGGAEEVPISTNALITSLNTGWGYFNYAQQQGEAQFLRRQTIQMGDGTVPTYVNLLGTSIELARTRQDIAVNQNSNFVPKDYSLDFIIRTSANDNMNFASSIIGTSSLQDFIIHASSNPAATFNFQGCSIISYRVTNNVSGVVFNGAVFSGNNGITLNGGGMDGCTVLNSAVSTAVTTNNPGNILDTEFISPGTGHAIEMTAVGTFDFEGNFFTGYGADASTDAAIYNNSGGLITLNLAPGDVAPTVRNGAGSSTVINAFTAEAGVEFSGLIAGSQVVVYTAGSTTELFRTNSSGTTEEYTEVTSLLEIDYTIQKAGYVPIRVTGLSLTSVNSVPVEQVEDRAYVASSGLTFGTNATANTGTLRFGLTAASTLQNYYSFMIERWIAESSLRNVRFPIVPNGPNSFTLVGGWEFAASADIAFLSRDGMRYTVAGVETAVYSAILSLGSASGLQAEYQQVAGATAIDANSTGPVDQLIQVYGDATHGNFDYRGYLRIKYQSNGFREAFTDVVNTYGTLADEFYIVSLEPQAIDGLTPGDPMVTGLTLTDHGASPVSWNAGNGAKNYSITIEDTGTNSAEDILRWLNYNLSLDATFQGKEPFNWPEMVLKSGDTYETLRGVVQGGVGAALKGVRVIRGSSPHPDFTRFQADDGTYGIPPVFQSVTLTGGVANSRVQLYDLTSNTELVNQVVTTFPFTWTDSAGYAADREIRLRVAYQSGVTAKLFIDQVIGTSTSSSPAVSFLISQEDDDVYITNGINGSTVTSVTIDDTALLVEVDTGTIAWAAIYAYETYWLYTEVGIRDEGRFIVALDPANYVLYDFQIKNVTTGPTIPLTITGGWGRDSVTGETIDLIDTTGGTIFSNPDLVIAYATGSGVTPGDITAIADAVAVDLTVVNNNVKKASLLIPATEDL